MTLPVQKSEARLCTLFIGVIQLYWSVLPLIGGDWRLIRVLRYFDHENEWALVMSVLGSMLITAALCPMRRLRHIALILSCCAWFGYFGLWVNYWADTGRWVISATFLTAPVLGIFCFVLLVNDVLQKPRPMKHKHGQGR